MNIGERPQHRHGELGFAITVTAIFAVYVFFVIFHHEPWRDEAQVWLAVRDMSPRQLFPWLGASGTPGLWYLIVMPLAKSGLPYLSMSLVHGALAVAVAWVIAYAAPFSRILRCLLIFSYLFAYEYAVVARPYVLTSLILLMIAAVMSRPRQRPVLLGALLFLLANANPHGFFISCVIASALFFAAAGSRTFSKALLVTLCIGGVGILLAFWQLLPPPGAQDLKHDATWWVVKPALSRAFFPHIPTKSWLPGGLAVHHNAASVFYVTRLLLVGWILLGTILSIRRNLFGLYVLILSFVSLFYVFLFRWYQGERHSGLILLVIIFVMWIDQSMRRRGMIAEDTHFTHAVRKLTRLALGVAMLISCGTGLVWAYRDVQYPYSLGKQMADHLRQAGLDGRVIASYPDSHGGAVLPYLSRSKRFWLVGRQEFGTYMIWDRSWLANLQLSPDEVIRRVEHRFPDRQFLLLDTRPLRDPEAHGYRLSFHSSAPQWMMRDEEYYLYEPFTNLELAQARAKGSANKSVTSLDND
jgi:hypothetical protein